MVTNKIIQWIQWIAIIIGVLLLVFVWNTRGQDISLRDFLLPGTPVMKIGGIPLRVEIAQTDAERTQGLSNRDKLAEGTGLLFVFLEADYHSMWMKDMRFPIDIIWISEDLRVVTVSKGITPDTFPKKFRPGRPAKYAVETNENYAETFGIREGQVVELPALSIEK